MSKPRIRYDYSKMLIQLLTIVSVVYYILNILYPTDYSEFADNANRIYPKLAAGVLFCLCLFISIIYYTHFLGNRIILISVIILILASVYIVYPLNIVPNIFYVMRYYMAILAMIASYVLLLKVKDVTYWEKHIAVIFAFQLAFGLFSLVSDKVSAVQMGDELFDSNSGFILVSCIPMTLLFPYKRFRVYLYCLVVLACIYTGQRSAALAAIISILPAMPILRRNVHKKDMAILLMAFVLFAIPLLVDAIQNIHDRNALDASKNNLGSGRLVFWGIVLTDFFSHDIFHIIFGNGTNSVAVVLESVYGLAIGAHNGWLDFLYTFGFIGLVIYATFFCVLLCKGLKSWKADRQYSFIILLMFVVFFFKASTSHGYFDISMMPYMIALSYVEGIKDRHGTNNL